MDSSLIYRKTPEGELSLSGRSHLRDQRLRAVLILIDGETSVGTLCEQFGDKFHPQATVSQLEQLGLIEPVPLPSEIGDEGSDSDSSAQAMDLSTAETTVEIAAPMPETAPAAQAEPEFPAAPPQSESPPAPFASMDVKQQEVTSNNESGAALLTERESDTAEMDAAPPEDSSPATEDWDIDREVEEMAAAAPVPPAHASPLRQTVLSWFSGRTKRAAEMQHENVVMAEAPSKSSRHDSIRPTRWRVWLSFALLGIIATTVGVGLFALPWNEYRGQLEAQASALTGQPVHIANMSLALLPYPQVVLSNISVGNQPLARISHASLAPSVRSVADLRRLAVNVVIEGLSLEQRAVAAVCGATRLSAATARQSHLRSIKITGLTLTLPGGGITDLQAEIGVSPEWDRPLVTMTDGSGELRVSLAPESAGCSFTADSPRWTLPIGNGIILSGLLAQGSLEDSGMRVKHFEARALDGILSGSGVLGWGQNVRLDLYLDLNHLSLEKTLASLGTPTVVHGELDGKLRFAATSPRLNELSRGLTGGGTIAVTHGAVDRFNLVEATRNPGKKAVYGGAFSFDRLTAQMQFSRPLTIAHNLNFSAGALQGDGEISMDNQRQLKGTVYANISSAVHRLRIPITVAGSLVSPELGVPVSAQSETAATAPNQNSSPAETAEVR